MTEKPPPSPSPPRRSSLVILLGLPTTLGLALLVGHAGFKVHWRSQAQTALAELEAEGLGLEGLYPPMPAQNGAGELLAASAELEGLDLSVGLMIGTRPAALAYAQAEPNTPEAGLVYSPGQGSPPTLAGAVALVEARLARATPLLDAGLTKPVVWPVAWEESFSVDLPHLTPIQTLAGALMLRAGWSDLSGRRSEAWRDLERMLDLGGTLRDPSPLTLLARCDLARRCVVTLEDLLSSGPPPDPQLRARLELRLAGLLRPTDFRDALRGELYAAQALGDTPLDLASEGLASAPMTAVSWERWRAQHTQLLADLIRRSQGSPREFEAYLQELDVVFARVEVNPVSLLVVPALGQTRLQVCRAEALLNLARAGLELSSRSSLPDTCENLPRDPFRYEGAGCRYRREPWGALLWSVGPDRVDSGGLQTSPPAAGEPDDLRFQLGSPR